MKVLLVLLEGPEGTVEIRNAGDESATFNTGEGQKEFTLTKDDDREAAFIAAETAATVLYGAAKQGRRKGGPQCTNSEIHEIFQMINRVAGR